jgi:putative mycofactocin binding protein MftB
VTTCEIPVAFDLHRAYRLNPAATLRPEPFGALVYHFGNRRLSFLKTRQLVTVVQLLARHDSAAGALEAAGVPGRQWASYAAALAALTESEVIDAR